MSSKTEKTSESDSELVKCQNCRQDILKAKMFLHEGFCLRNNVFCEHCEKVYLKKDFEYHVKSIKKDSNPKDNDSSAHSQKSKDTKEETNKPSSFIEEIENISNNTITLAPSPSLEIVQMPVTEMLKINAPIFVSETGQIVSNKNKNEYLLPFLGINFRSSKINEKILDDIIDKGDIFKENNNIINKFSDDFQDLNEIINKNNSRSKFNNTINTNSMKNYRKSKFSTISIPFRGNDSIKLVNQNYYKNDSSQKNTKTIEINNLNSIEESNKENIKQNIPINKSSFASNLMAHHSQKILNSRKYNFFTLQQTPKKFPMNNNSITKSIQGSLKKSIPLDSNNKNRNFYHNNNEKYNNQSNNKEPKDSNSKLKNNRNSFQFNQISGQKINSGNDYDIERCKYCNNLFTPIKFSSHIHKCKKKKMSKLLEIPKPKKKAQTKETFICEDDEEAGIDIKNRETLKRPFNTSLNVLSLNYDNSEIINDNRKNIPQQKMSSKISLKKRLFQNTNEVKIDRKNYPKDTIKEEKINIKNSPVIKKLRNLSLDGYNNSISHNMVIYNQKSPTMTSATNRYVPSGKIEPWLFFNNDKVILKHPKDKKSLRFSKF